MVKNLGMRFDDAGFLPTFHRLNEDLVAVDVAHHHDVFIASTGVERETARLVGIHGLGAFVDTHQNVFMLLTQFLYATFNV